MDDRRSFHGVYDVKDYHVLPTKRIKKKYKLIIATMYVVGRWISLL